MGLPIVWNWQQRCRAFSPPPPLWSPQWTTLAPHPDPLCHPLPTLCATFPPRPGCVRTSESPTLSPWIETTPKQDLSSRIPWKIRGQHTSWGNFIWDTTFFPSLSRTPLAVSPGSDSLISHVHINFHLRVCCWGTNLRYPTFIKILSII